MLKFLKNLEMPTSEQAPKGRAIPLLVPERHFVLGSSMAPPWPDSCAIALFGMGCFWGAERIFWQMPGVYSTQVGYTGGLTPNPTYEEVCSGQTGHNEVVRVIFYPDKISYDTLLQMFWEGHDPTQGMRQGNDVGTQYRSGVYVYDAAQMARVKAIGDAYRGHLKAAGYGAITTETLPAAEFYYAEEYHQQYLGKNPHGYCGLGGTHIACPSGLDL